MTVPNRVSLQERLLSRLDRWLGGLFTAAGVLFYLVLLVGRDAMGWAYGPALGVLGLVLAGLGLRWLHRRQDLRLRLRSAAPALLLAASFLLALGLRLWRARQEVPAAGSDESFFVEAALGIIQGGNYLPPALRYPSLLVYVELAAGVLRFVSGASGNLWTWPTELAAGDLYGWGRGAVALLSAATLLPVYWIGEKLYGWRAGLLAALFLALLRMHAAAGAVVAAEPLAGLLALLASWFALRLLEEGRPAWALAAGACAGLAAAGHYPAGLALLVPLLAALLRRPETAAPSRGTLVLLALAAALGGFLAGCPAALFKVDRLIAGLAEAARAYFPPAGTAGTGLHYLLREGLGWGPALLAAAGGAFIVARLRRADVVLFSFPSLLYLALLLPRARFPRDLVPLAPFLALLAAVGVERLCVWGERRFPGRPWVRYLPWGLALLGAALFAWS